MHGEEAGEIENPRGIAVAADGTIYVADRDANRVEVFNSQGTFLFAFGGHVDPTGNGNVCTFATGCRRGTNGSAAGETTPKALAIGLEGNVFVADASNVRIEAYAPGGAFLYAFGKGVNPVGMASNPDLCTAETGCRFGQQVGDAGAVDQPEGIGFDRAGEVLVADQLNHRIDVFTPAGEFIRARAGPTPARWSPRT